MTNLNWMTLSRDKRRILNDIVMDAEAHARAAREIQERRAGNASSVGDRVTIPSSTLNHLKKCVGSTCQSTFNKTLTLLHNERAKPFTASSQAQLNQLHSYLLFGPVEGSRRPVTRSQRPQIGVSDLAGHVLLLHFSHSPNFFTTLGVDLGPLHITTRTHRLSSHCSHRICRDKSSIFVARTTF